MIREKVLLDNEFANFSTDPFNFWLDETGIDSVYSNTILLESSGEFLHIQEVGQFALEIRFVKGVRFFAVQIFLVDAAEVMNDIWYDQDSGGRWTLNRRI